MTKRDFELIARALYIAKPKDTEGSAEYGQWVKTIGVFVSALPSTNSNFDAAKFTHYSRTGGYK